MFDARVHAQALSDQDLETLVFFGVKGALIPSGVGADVLAQVARLEKAGLRGCASLGVHPRRAPKRGLAALLEVMPTFFRGGRVRAIGLIGLASGGQAEEAAFLGQLELTLRFNLPVLVQASGGTTLLRVARAESARDAAPPAPRWHALCPAPR